MSHDVVYITDLFFVDQRNQENYVCQTLYRSWHSFRQKDQKRVLPARRQELFLGFTLFSSTLICWSTITYFRYLELIDPEEQTSRRGVFRARL